MKNIFYLAILFVCCTIVTGCSTSAYVMGYNLVATEDTEIGLDLGQEDSSTAFTLFNLETAHIGNSQLTPLMFVTVPMGVALSPVFFVIGNVSGAIFTLPSRLTPIEDRSVKERRKLAHISTSTQTLTILADDEDRPVRQAVAGNLNTSPTVLRELAKDRETSVRNAVADNPNTPAQVLAWLIADEDEYVRASAFTNPNTPDLAKEEPKKEQAKGSVDTEEEKEKENSGDWWGDLPYLEQVEDWWSDDEND